MSEPSDLGHPNGNKEEHGNKEGHIVFPKFLENEFLDWLSKVTDGLKNSGIVGFLDGSVPLPEESKEAEQWVQTNKLICDALLVSMNEAGKERLPKSKDASVIWKSIQDMYAPLKNFLLIQKISSISQGTLSVKEFNEKFNDLWSKIDLNRNALEPHKTVSFLMGLGEKYACVRSKLLLAPMHSLEEVYHMIGLQENPHELLVESTNSPNIGDIPSSSSHVHGAHGEVDESAFKFPPFTAESDLTGRHLFPIDEIPSFEAHNIASSSHAHGAHDEVDESAETDLTRRHLFPINETYEIPSFVTDAPISSPVPLEPTVSSATQGRGMRGRGRGRGMRGRGRWMRGRTVARDNLLGISKSSIRKLAKRGGVHRMSGLIYDETRRALHKFLTDVIGRASIYCEYANRKTLTSVDIMHALKNYGMTMYGDFDA